MTRRAIATAWLLVAALCAGNVATAQTSAGDDDAALATARSQYAAGTKAFADQRYTEAALAFEAAADAKPSGVALYTAGLSWDRSNAADRAADDYARCLTLPGLPADKASQARERLATLESSLGIVAVTGPDGTKAGLEGNSERLLPASFHGQPGTRALTIRAADGTVDHRSVVIERGKTAHVDVAAPAPPPAAAPAPAPVAPPPVEPAAAPPPPPAPPPADWQRTVGVAALGAGGAMLLGGVVLGLEAVNAKNAYDAAPAQATYDHASQLQTWTNVAFIAGGVVTAGGLALVLWPSHASSGSGASPSDSPSNAPSGVSLRLVPAPGGALVRGSF